MAQFPRYFTIWQKLGLTGVKLTAWLVLLFLMAPILVIIPLSFNAEPYFTFTEGMLAFDPDAYSLKWYQEILAEDKWMLAIKNSFYIGIMATIIATVLGTTAAIGLTRSEMPFQRMIMALLLSPMIVPLIITAAGMFFFYTQLDIAGSYLGVILAHAALGTPFVVITVNAALSGFDYSLVRASLGMGAKPVYTFFKVIMPLIRPGVISGALFAFVTSFDEVIVVLFLAGPEQRTIPRQMFSGLREEINPTILAVATLLVIISGLLLLTMEYLRARSEKMRTG
ncbi:Spermidine Putrescine ABC transporter permease component potC [Marinobacterium lacunae]|uniref:Spermidine Putrescine ABC transporter permease component potC n=1 Tax=Marinobacterium lacunae TaxID=1232683 RepID=A0A081G1Q2_9GAMM|nr:ABC transporter permease [Marinobacterium lacunae]KEA64707.1 Spermidine Putrescine ABC transporter permease component potC [Marinobacterium lacunae]MBR9883919.1 ABC transporter permease [Oceanospirillales bacterium]